MKNFKSDSACVACGTMGDGVVCLHHLYTRKSRSDLQIKPWNLIPCCIQCHNMFHNKGTRHMAGKYQGVNSWLVDNGWKIDDFTNKWVHPKANEGTN